ncbi:MAG: adenylate/guanylate cyclase domain-containing protein [Pseudomonadota bacterium]
MAQWSITPVIDWLLHEGRHLAAPDALVGDLCARVRAAGMPIDRVAFFFGTLHPQYFGIAMYWDGAGVRVLEASFQMAETDEVRNSPARRITEGERVIRRRLERADCPADFPVLQELRAAGMTDYVIAEVVFGNGSRNSVSLATRRPGGFTDHDIFEVQRLLHPFGMAMEIHVGRALSKTLLETYLGRISGSRVLEGQIKRGDGEEIEAVIWFSDLRDSTPLSRTLGERRFLDLLNDYFEATAGAVLEHGGEVLRFIGDASLAVFPTAAGSVRDACERAVRAARAARLRAGAANAKRHAAGLPVFASGVGLHLGRVLYGNIGTPERLEFSVIGAAANEAARIEGLCKETGQDVVLSQTVAAQLGAPCPSLGKFALRGVAQPVEVFALP